MFHEVYGEIPRGMLTAIKRHNISPSDYYMLEDEGYDPKQIMTIIKNTAYHTPGSRAFSWYRFKTD